MITYYNIRQLADLLNLNYDFLWKYLKKEMEEDKSQNIRMVLNKYHVEDFINAHLYPPGEKIDINMLLSHADGSVWSMNEVFEYLKENDLPMHYTTLWRKVNKNEVTVIKINKAFRFPIYKVKTEIQTGKYKKKY